MKVVGLTILRAGKDLSDPIPISMACDLTSYGYFQRQVRYIRQNVHLVPLFLVYDLKA